MPDVYFTEYFFHCSATFSKAKNCYTNNTTGEDRGIVFNLSINPTLTKKTGKFRFQYTHTNTHVHTLSQADMFVSNWALMDVILM